MRGGVGIPPPGHSRPRSWVAAALPQPRVRLVRPGCLLLTALLTSPGWSNGVQAPDLVPGCCLQIPVHQVSSQASSQILTFFIPPEGHMEFLKSLRGSDNDPSSCPFLLSRPPFLPCFHFLFLFFSSNEAHPSSWFWKLLTLEQRQTLLLWLPSPGSICWTNLSNRSRDFKQVLS